MLLDVRELPEIALARIDGACVLPMSEITRRIGELPRDRPIVVMCHSGGRSARVALYLAAHGFKDVYNLAGGIDAWSRDLDASIPRY
jgi:rhodanese-related sulfurtransferase